MRIQKLATLVVAAAVAACGGNRAEVSPGAGAPTELGSSLNVRVEGDSVRLMLHVTNVTSGPIALEFSSGQRYDFEVSEPDGDTVWRWSATRSFMQATGREVLQPGESKQYMETWHAPERDEEYVATAWLTSTNYPVELRTIFRPGD